MEETGFKLRSVLEPWLIWLTVSGLAWMGGLVLALMVQRGIEDVLPASMAAMLGMLVGGALLGMIQYSYLPDTGRNINGWLPASSAGWAVGLWLANLPAALGPAWLGGLIGGLLGGACMGLLQSRALVDQGNRRRWFYETLAGWALAFFLGSLLLELPEMARPSFAELISFGSPGGLGWIFGAMVGVFGLLFFFPPARKGTSWEEGGQDQEKKLKMW